MVSRRARAPRTGDEAPVHRSGAPGGSALAVWERGRRRHRRRLVLSRTSLVACAGSLAIWRLWPSSGWPAVAVAAAAALVALRWAPEKDPERWLRGAQGEVATAHILGSLPARRWAVFHDLRLPGTRANVDHLVIGPSGVWVVDSKWYRARLSARRGRVMAGRTPLSTESTCFEARAVSLALGCPVKAVVAVHGEGLPRRGRPCAGATVLPAGRLLRHLRRGSRLRPVLSRRQVSRLVAAAEETLGGQKSGGGRRPGARRPLD